VRCSARSLVIGIGKIWSALPAHVDGAERRAKSEAVDGRILASAAGLAGREGESRKGGRGGIGEEGSRRGERGEGRAEQRRVRAVGPVLGESPTGCGACAALHELFWGYGSVATMQEDAVNARALTALSRASNHSVLHASDKARRPDRCPSIVLPCPPRLSSWPSLSRAAQSLATRLDG